MSGANLTPRNDAPRATPNPFNRELAATPQGAPIQNFSQNHPAAAVSLTRSADDTVDNNEFYVAPAKPVAKLPQQPESQVIKPGEYHPGIINQMLEYFDRPKMKKIIDTYTWKSGAVSEKERFTPNTPPHFSEFARQIGVTTRQLKAWARKYPEFGVAYEQCQEILEEFLIDNGLVGAYGAIAMKFVAVNRSKMKDKQVHENHTVNLNEVLDKIAAGQIKPGGLIEENNDDNY